MKLQHAVCAAAAALLLAACGGGSDHAPEAPPPEATEVPASATVSATAYTQYAASLRPSETANPLGVSLVTTPPTSETEAPMSF
jgi:hypothetical protein